jgi:hypothetical protein
MSDENNINGPEVTPPSRRELVKKSAQVAVTAPAVALLLNASTKQAFAQAGPYVTNHHILDDFTFGNSEEDIDSHVTGTNFTRFGKPAQDDHVPG